MFDRLRKKVPYRDAVAADEEPASGLERLGECIQAGLRLASAAALHFDSDYNTARTRAFHSIS